MTLTFLDLAIICVPLVLVLGVSIYLRRYMKSVADFLAANRGAGRFLIATAGAETGATVMAMITSLEVFSRVGWSLAFWGSFSGVFYFVLGLLGVVGYRFRQTRSLTFHQFFEARYSRGMRIYASFLYAFSGCLTFGVQPAVGARFFVYFCGVPDTMHLGALTMPTYVPVMLLLMALSLYFALSGGQISVMVTDCLEGVISSIFYLIVAGFLVWTLSIADVKAAMLSGPSGASFVDPFDIHGQSDFNQYYVLFNLLIGMAVFRGNAWNQGFAAAAKSPHEGRMAAILGNWRGYSGTAMSALVALGAFTLMHNPHFNAPHAAVDQAVNNISVPQYRAQMVMPLAIGHLLVPGVKGCFCAVLLFGLLAGQGQQLHNYGSTFLQDVVLPAFRIELPAKAHVWWLKFSVFCVATFACLFSLWFKPVDTLVLAMALLGSLYLSGIGPVVWGGLYSRKGTTAGAWAAMLTGSLLSATFFLMQQYWTSLQPHLVTLLGTDNRAAQYVAAHANKIPLNGQQLMLLTVVLAFIGYLVVSALTFKRNFDLDALLHRGKYRVASDDLASAATVRPSWAARILNIDEHFTRADKTLTYFTFVWTIFWQLVSVGVVLWTLTIAHLSPDWWFDYYLFTTVILALVVAVPTTVWFTFGVAKDLHELVRTLRFARRNETDDGEIHASTVSKTEGVHSFERV